MWTFATGSSDLPSVVTKSPLNPERDGTLPFLAPMGAVAAHPEKTTIAAVSVVILSQSPKRLMSFTP